MKTPSPSEFAQAFLAAAGEPQEFRPFAHYDPDGDCIEFFAQSEPYFGSRIDDLVTVYRSQESNEIVGALIKGAKSFCKKMLAAYPGISIEIEEGGRVKIECLFRVKAYQTSPLPGEKRIRYDAEYKELIEVAKASGVTAEIPCMV